MPLRRNADLDSSIQYEITVLIILLVLTSVLDSTLLKRGCTSQIVNLFHFIVVYLISVFASISLFRKRIVSVFGPYLHSPIMIEVMD